jgi:hypothetical protein
VAETIWKIGSVNKTHKLTIKFKLLNLKGGNMVLGEKPIGRFILSMRPKAVIEHLKCRFIKFTRPKITKLSELEMLKLSKRTKVSKQSKQFRQLPKRSLNSELSGFAHVSILALAALAAAVLMWGIVSGCQGVLAPLDTDPAQRALGQASIKVVAERMQNAQARSGIGPLSSSYHLSSDYIGNAAEALMGISRAMGFGLWVQDQKAGTIELTLISKDDDTLLALLADINRQLKPHGAAVGADVLNRVLVLSGGKR